MPLVPRLPSVALPFLCAWLIALSAGMVYALVLGRFGSLPLVRVAEHGHPASWVGVYAQAKSNLRDDRVLATLKVRGLIPVKVNGTITNIPVLSAVLVHKQFGVSTPLLALSLLAGDNQRRLGGGHPAPRRLTELRHAARASVHHVVYGSGETAQFYKPSGFQWYATVPSAEAAAWANRSAQSTTCITFDVVDANRTSVASMTDCHRPSLLPMASKPYDITFCYATPPSGVAVNQLPQSLVYHLGFGASQMVVYLHRSGRNHITKLLSPFVSRGLVTIVLIDDAQHISNAHAYESTPIVGASSDAYELDFETPFENISQHMAQQVLINDCLNRFKGLSEFVVSLDFDEYLVPYSGIPSRMHGIAQAAFGNCPEADFEYFLWTMWKHPAGERQLLIEGQLRENHTHFSQLRKPIMRPERVVNGWVHYPLHCGTPPHMRACTTCAKPHTGPGAIATFAHIRLPQDVPGSSLVRDHFFDVQVDDVRAELCALMRESDMGCSPTDWSPA